jgi:penicillin-binding protein 1C
MDRGYVLPQSLIKDVPTYYGAYSPENADHLYRGVVSVKDALTSSLNIPAVRMLNKVGVGDFYYFLKNAGLKKLFRAPEEYGLSLILGGGEITLEELIKLYLALGNRGIRKELIYTTESPAGKPEHIISDGAAWLTVKMLTEVKRSGIEYYLSQWKSGQTIAWKTGTSFGHRDAWAIGISEDWVVGVWCGDFRSVENPMLMGYSSAGPLLFRIFRELPSSGRKDWIQIPDSGLKQVELCAESGFRAGEFCSQTITAFQPVKAPPLKVCPYHRLIYMDQKTHFEVCSRCWNREDVVKDTMLIFPPDVIQFRRKMGFEVVGYPIHNPDCPTISHANLTILYPKNNSKIYLPRDYDQQREKLVIRAASDLKDDQFFWFLDHRFIGQTKMPHEQALTIPPGFHTLMIINSRGQKCTSVFQVIY